VILEKSKINNRTRGEVPVGVRVTIAPGYDAAYPWQTIGAAEGGKSSTDYYMSPAEGGGEPPGRWWGKAAAALGLEPGSLVERQAYDLLVDQRVDPRDGISKLSRSPHKGIERADAVYEKLLAAEPEATRGRRRALRTEAQKAARQGPLYFDLTVSLSKSISVFYASLGENLRQAQLAGDQAGAEYWAGLIAEVDEMIHAANQAGLDYFEQEAGYVRTGYHGGWVDGQETGQWHEAELAFASFLQHTSRADDIQLHVHNVVAHTAKTVKDGKWRAPFSYAYNVVHNGVAPIVALHLESALNARFGVEWVPRADGYGHEMANVPQEVMDCLSTRRGSINAEMRERARVFEHEHGRAPTQRELAKIAQLVTLDLRAGKAEGALHLDALHETWAERVRREAGAELRDIAPGTWGQASGPGAHAPGGSPGPAPEALTRAAQKALVSVQAHKSAWTRYDLLKHLGWMLPAETRHMTPADAVRLLHKLAGDTLADRYGDVRCLDAPDAVRLPASLTRADGRSVYQPHTGALYATQVQLTAEERMVARARRPLAPLASRERVAQLLGADAAMLGAQLLLRAEAGSETTTTTGLRLDQAAVIYQAFTDGRLATTVAGPAGSGKTYTLVAAGLAAKQAGAPEVWGVTCAQAARNVLAEAAGRAGLPIRAYNSVKLFDGLDAKGSHRLRIALGSLIIIDEASMMPVDHLARIIGLADDLDCKVLVAGDQEQLAAVEGGGGMRLLARENGYVQLAEPVRFENAWERSASLRLRTGDASVLSEYDARGRIRGGDPDQVMDDAVRAAVAERLAGQDVLLVAADRERCRELARRVRDDLIHLGLVDDGPAVRLAEGAEASRGDLVIARKNDHRHGIANGDVLLIDRVGGDTVTLRRAMDRDPATGAMKLEKRHITCNFSDFSIYDLGYCITGHSSMGRTVTAGIPVIAGNENRQWLYTAMTRGAARNYAYVMSQTPRKADPAPGAAPAPELARYDRQQRLRDGLPAGTRIWLDVPFAEKDEAAQAGAQWDYEAKRWYAPEAGIKALARWDPAANRRDPAAVLADVLHRDGAEKSASEIQQQNRRNADHLAALNAIWQGEIASLRAERYRQILREVLPSGYADGADTSPQATWLWRTLRSAEAAGLDARQVIREAVESRSLAGSRDVASVIDARIRERIGSPVPQAQDSWSARVPDIADVKKRKMFCELAAAMDERTERLGPFTAEQRPEWAIQALGEVPAYPRQRAEWERRAAPVAAYREMYGHDHPTDPIGPEPSCDSPDKRAAWHAALQALGSVDGPDIRGLPDGSLWLMRDTYETETALAPKYVADELRQIRLGAQDARLTSVRADAEAEVAGQRGDDTLAGLHRTHARSARALQAFYQHRLPQLEQQDAQYQEWEHVTEGPRRIAVAADAELRRRQPRLAIAPLKSAEPDPVTEQEHEQLLSPSDEALARPAKPPEWVARLAAARDALQEKLDDRKAVRVPADDHEMQDEGEAWPALRPRERDAILQPPPPEMPASPRVIERARQQEADREAGG
jgi:TrwC relaxase/AAA domain/Domain of unknown function (DUF5710)